MSELIHPTAIIEPGAKIGAAVQIGAYAFVGAGVELGAGTRLHHHASVEGRTTLGRKCEVFPYACIGGKTQDLKFKGGLPGVRIGDNNVFREYVTVHAGTYDGDFTVIGDRNTILAYSHVAHDCVVGNDCVMSNGTMLAGHVIVEDHVSHRRLRRRAPILPPRGLLDVVRHGEARAGSAAFFIADGTPAVARAFNEVGLERNGHTPAQLDRVKQIFRILYR